MDDDFNFDEPKPEKKIEEQPSAEKAAPKQPKEEDPFNFADDDFNFDVKQPAEEKSVPKEQPVEKKPAAKKGFFDAQPTSNPQPAENQVKPVSQ